MRLATPETGPDWHVIPRFKSRPLGWPCLLASMLWVLLVEVGHGREMPNHAVILQYHHVNADTPASTSVTPEQFREHLEAIEAGGHPVLSLTDVAEALNQGTELPDRTVVITFDDGYRSVYEAAFPLLRERGWPFTVFVHTEPLDYRNPLFVSWDQLREMAAAGATVANHTRTHAHLLRREAGEAKDDWADRVRGEIRDAQQRIEQELGPSPAYLAYPYGEYSPEVERIVAALGFLGFGQHSGAWGSNESSTSIPRYPASGVYADVQALRTKLASLPLPVLEHRPEGGLVEHTEHAPDLELDVAPGAYRADQFACYASGQGPVAAEWRPNEGGGGILRVRPHSGLPVGRSRYNCTAPHRSEPRYYWYSFPWYRKTADGGWVPD